jgi:hypothetical protein
MLVLSVKDIAKFSFMKVRFHAVLNTPQLQRINTNED